MAGAESRAEQTGEDKRSPFVWPLRQVRPAFLTPGKRFPRTGLGGKRSTRSFGTQGSGPAQERRETQHLGREDGIAGERCPLQYRGSTWATCGRPDWRLGADSASALRIALLHVATGEALLGSGRHFARAIVYIGAAIQAFPPDISAAEWATREAIH